MFPLFIASLAALVAGADPAPAQGPAQGSVQGSVQGSAQGSAQSPVQGPAPASPEHHLIDMVVAQVDASVITLSELVAETRLVLLRTGGPEVARAGHLSQGLLNAVLKSMVSRELLLGEVRRLKLHNVPEEAVAKSIAGIKQRFASSSDYERFLDRAGFREPGSEQVRELDAPPSLVAIVLAELEAEQFLEVRIRRNVLVRDSDIALCFEMNKARFEGRTLEDVSEQIRGRIQEQRQQRALEVLIAQLEKRATVRYTPGFEAEKEPEEDAVGLSCPEAAKPADEKK